MRSIEALKSGMLIGVGFLSVVSVAYAAISWPSTPSGETAGGKYSTRLVPTGFVGAFNGTTCPAGWSTADGSGDEKNTAWANTTLDLRGTFLRGIWGDANGRDVARSVGNYQWDTFQSHAHTYIGMVGDNSIDGVDSTTVNSWEHHNESRATNSIGGTETRPKNVAVLYCVKD